MQVNGYFLFQSLHVHNYLSEFLNRFREATAKETGFFLDSKQLLYNRRF